MKNTALRKCTRLFEGTILLTLLSGCGQKFEDLPPDVATRALAQCFAYHSTVKKDIASVSHKMQDLMSKPNVRGNFQAEGNAWIYAHSFASAEQKASILDQAQKACKQVGLPF